MWFINWSSDRWCDVKMGLASPRFSSEIENTWSFKQNYSAPRPITLGHRYETSTKKTRYLKCVFSSKHSKGGMVNQVIIRTQRLLIRSAVTWPAGTAVGSVGHIFLLPRHLELRAGGREEFRKWESTIFLRSENLGIRHKSWSTSADHIWLSLRRDSEFCWQIAPPLPQLLILSYILQERQKC